MKILIISILLVLAVYLIRYFLKLIIYKGADSISSAIKKNRRKAPETSKPEDLADRYK